MLRGVFNFDHPPGGLKLALMEWDPPYLIY